MKINKLLESKKLKEGITNTEPVVKFQGKSSHTFTKDKKWEVDFDEAGNILARTRHGKPSYFKGHINDKTNDFPSTDEDNIILAAREQHGLKFGKKNEAFEKDGGPFWYFTRHGLGPGMLPKGVNVVDTIEDDNFGTYIALDKVLSTQELRDYELKEKKPNVKEGNSHLDEGSIPRNASRIRVTDREGKRSMDLHKHGKYWRDDGDEFSYKAYDTSYLRKPWYDIEVLETDPNYKPNRTKPEYVVQGNYGYGWEDLTTSDNQAEARNDLKAYRENETGVPHRLITRRVPVTENLKEAFKPSDSGIQSVKCYNRYNYTIQELRVDNDNKTFERGNFTAGKADKKTKNRQEFEDIVDTLKELGYTEIKSDYRSMRNKSRKGNPTSVEEGYELSPRIDYNPNHLRDDEGKIMADRWYESKWPDDEVGIEQLQGITLDDALKDRSILGHCDTQVRERVYAQLDKYIPLSKESPIYKEKNESKESEESELITQYINNGEYDKLEKVHNGTNVVWKLKEPVNEYWVGEDEYDDDFDYDMAHTNLYGGDSTYCRDCGTKKKYDDTGFSYCPNCDGITESKSLTEYYDFIKTKSVKDMDGFNTDYTMYKDVVTGKYVFVFGDTDIYGPEDGYFDWECDTEQEAEEWFNSYTGFDDMEDNEWGGYDFNLDEDVEKSPIIHKKSDGSYLVTAENGDGYVAYNKDDVCMGNISANNENEAKSKFNSNQFDE